LWFDEVKIGDVETGRQREFVAYKSRSREKDRFYPLFISLSLWILDRGKAAGIFAFCTVPPRVRVGAH